MLPLISKSVGKLDSKCELMPLPSTTIPPTDRSQGGGLQHSKSCNRCMHNDHRNYEIKLKDGKDKDDIPCMSKNDRDDMHK